VARTRAGDHGIELLKVFVESIVVEDEAWVIDIDGADCHREPVSKKIYDII
jgi:hypothetical protein